CSSPLLENSAGVSSSRNANRVGSPCWSPHPVCVVGVRRCPTLPHTTVCSTIGAQGLSFRVRDGSGRFPLAMTAVTVYVNNGPLSLVVWGLLFQKPYSGRVFTRGCFVFFGCVVVLLSCWLLVPVG